MTENKNFPGYRSIGRKLNVDLHTTKKVLDKIGVKVSKRKKVPKTSEKQQSSITGRLPRLIEELNYRHVVLDDETYFDLNGRDLHGVRYV